MKEKAIKLLYAKVDERSEDNHSHHAGSEV